jgi:hypothetical protein
VIKVGVGGRIIREDRGHSRRSFWLDRYV